MMRSTRLPQAKAAALLSHRQRAPVSFLPFNIPSSRTPRSVLVGKEHLPLLEGEQTGTQLVVNQLPHGHLKHQREGAYPSCASLAAVVGSVALSVIGAVKGAYNAWVLDYWLSLACYGNGDLRRTAAVHPAVLVVANHNDGALDFAVVAHALKHTYGFDQVLVVADKATSSMLATQHPRRDVIPVLRSKGATLLEVEAIREAVRRSPGRRKAVVVLPEVPYGEPLNGPCGLRSFRLSIGYLASKLGYPVVPAFVSGTDKALPPFCYVPNRHHAMVEFGLPLRAPKDQAQPRDIATLDPEVLVPAERRELLATFDAQLRASLVTLGRSLAAKAQGRGMKDGPWPRRNAVLGSRPGEKGVVGFFKLCGRVAWHAVAVASWPAMVSLMAVLLLADRLKAAPLVAAVHTAGALGRLASAVMQLPGTLLPGTAADEAREDGGYRIAWRRDVIEAVTEEQRQELAAHN